MAAAYGWPADISEEDTLAKLLELNLARAAAGAAATLKVKKGTTSGEGTMSRRMFANWKIEELEKLFDEKRGKMDVMTSLGELSHRRTSRARELKTRVLQTLR